MLLWGTAVGVPLYLHFRRRGNREIAWGAMRILRAVQQQHARSLRLWRLLLLALRLLIVLALTLALANPLLRSAALSGFGARDRLQILAVDCSASMLAVDDGVTTFDRAIAKASESTEQAGNHQYLVFQMPGLSNPPEAMIPVGGGDAQQQLDQLAATMLPLDARLELFALAERVAALRTARPDFTRVDLTVLTDGQQSSWKDVTRDDVEQLQRQLGSGGRLELVSVSEVGQPSNVAVHGAELAVRPAIAGQDNALVVQLKNYGSEAAEQSVEIARDESTVWSRRVQIAGGETSRIEFPFRPMASPELLTVSVSEDGFTADNTLTFPVAPISKIRVRQVGAGGAIEEFVETAISVAFGPAEAEVLRTPLEEETGASPEEEVVLVQSIARLTAGERAAVVAQVRRGAGLLVCLGPGTDRASIRAWLQELDLDVEPLSVVEPETLRVDPLEYRHPISNAFGQHPDSGLTDLPVLRYWKLQPSAGGEVREVLRLSTGDPLLLAGSVGFGRALVLATPLHSGLESDAAWNAIAVSPVFVPLLDQSVRWLLAGDVQTVDTGDSLIVNTEIAGRVVGPDGRTLWSGSEDVETGSSHAIPVAEVGVYRVSSSADLATAETVHWTVGRLNPKESDLVRRALPQVEDQPAELASRDGGHSLLLMLIPLCGLLMLGESMVAFVIRRRFA